MIRVLLVALVLTTSACSRVATWKPLPISVSPADAEPVRSLLETQGMRPEHGKYLYRATVRSGDERNYLRYAIVFARPESLRIEALPLNGFYSLAMVVVREGQVLSFDPGSKEVLRGHNAKLMLGRLLRLALDSPDIIALVNGTIPAHVLTTGVQVSRDEDRRELDVRDVGGHMLFRLDAERLQLRAAQIIDVGATSPTVVLSYGEYEETSGLRLPKSLDITLPALDASIQLELISASLTQPSPSLFEPQIPAGYSVRELEE